MGVLVSLALLLGIGTAPLSFEPPERYPAFDADTATPFLVVATTDEGRYLPDLPGCDPSDCIRLDPPPFWFTATIEAVVLGDALPATLPVATTSHYGTFDAADVAGKPYLLSLRTDGRHVVMPRYQRARLHRDASGNHYLMVLTRRPIHWLPCSAWNLREDVDPSSFPDAAIPLDAYRQFYAEDGAGLFEVDARQAVPRYGIPMHRLRAHLAAMAPSAADLACRPEQEHDGAG